MDSAARAAVGGHRRGLAGGEGGAGLGGGHGTAAVDVASVDEAARTADEATGGKGEAGASSADEATGRGGGAEAAAADEASGRPWGGTHFSWRPRGRP